MDHSELNLNRSSFYYEPVQTSTLNLELMEKIDKHYLEKPFKGARRMHVYLTKDLGYEVSLVIDRNPAVQSIESFFNWKYFASNYFGT